MTKVRVPQITDIKTAIEIYYSRIELTNSDIEQIFGSHSSSTISKLKKKAKEEMLKTNTPVGDDRRVNTRAAYKAWGLYIDDLEFRYNKLKKLDKGY